MKIIKEYVKISVLSVGLTACGSSFAQSSVTLYGVIDTGIEMITHADANGDRIVRVPANTGSMASRWGIRGNEDLGGGLAAVFTLENGFNTRGGDIGQGGRFFGRQAWLGLASPFGTLTFGRQYTMTMWALADADALGTDIYGGNGSLDSYIPSARSDNTIAFKGSRYGFTLGATYSFGRDSAGTGNSPGQGTCAGPVAGDSQACRQWSIMLRYDGAAFGVAAAYDEQRGGPGAAASFFNGTAPMTLTASDGKDARAQLNGYFKIGSLKVGSGWLGRRVDTVAEGVPNVRSNIFYLTSEYYVTPTVVLDGGVYRMINADQDTRATQVALRGMYLLSKQSSVYLQSAYLFNSAKARYTVSQGGAGATPGAGMGQLAIMAGIRHMF